MSRAPSVRICAQPLVDGDPVPGRGPAGPGRVVERDPAAHQLELRGPGAELDQVGQRDPGQVAAVALEVAAPGDQLVAGAVLRERRDAELVGQAQDPVLGRPDRLAAEIEDVVADPARQRAAADPIAGLDHDHVGPGGAELARRAQARQPGADH